MSELKKIEMRNAWLLLVLWALVIAFLTLMPAESIPKVEIRTMDKVLHLLEFFALGFLLLNAFRKSDFGISIATMVIVTVVICSIYAGLGEWLQNFVSGRHADIYDLLSDLIGLNLGVLMYIRGVHDWH